MVTWWQLCVCSLGILLLTPCSLAEKFSLAGSPSPVVGVIGQDVVLPCQLSPPARLPSMDVLWRKIGTGFIPVHEYMDEGSQNLPGESYQNRTELFPQEFSRGNVSLKLKRLQEADAGTYHCFVKNPEWSQEAITELGIAAVAPVFIDVLGPRGQGIGLACRSAGWFPKPELQWVGKHLQNLAMEIVSNVTQDRENLYSVVSHITVTEGEDNGDISCIVWNGLPGTEQRSAIHLSGDVFPRVSPWRAAFWVMFTLFLIAAGACVYRGHTAKRNASQKKPSTEETLLNLETEKTTLDTDCQELYETLDTEEKEKQALKSDTAEKEKQALKSECQDLPQKNVTNEKRLKSEGQELHEKLEWRKSRNIKENFTLDAGTAHPNLSISDDKKSLKHEAQPQNVPPNPERCCLSIL
ncbi:butyrophilin subfamily 3 member A2-like [Mauremys reevesii]|uniref:butyrophilin subfamily 3 member A2-like n=1 Tax=Mauremys reevesii TaxID=260615 RepID=UPI00194011AF|nr:butyrophilin subfamily 3 member A2-like [Mauremys reevesii]